MQLVKLILYKPKGIQTRMFNQPIRWLKGIVKKKIIHRPFKAPLYKIPLLSLQIIINGKLFEMCTINSLEKRDT